ncbi:ABC transporter six-transmembrane domain-containing protein [Roseibium sp. M-1]
MPIRIDLAFILKAFRRQIGLTWGIVLVENILIALIPLFIGMSVDGLLAGRITELLWLVTTLSALGMVAIARRLYDTRAYGTIRLRLGHVLQDRTAGLEVSRRTVRVDMTRELVDFLEKEVPELLTAIIQIAVSLGVLIWFGLPLGISALAVGLGIILVYGCFHRVFYAHNGRLNDQRERQVELLAGGSRLAVFRHLRALRSHEVAISDTEAVVYGSIFLLQVAFIAFNLHAAAALPDVTAGRIFSIATYSWEYVEAALMLPLTLQSWSRLSEITRRINSPETGAQNA